MSSCVTIVISELPSKRTVLDGSKQRVEVDKRGTRYRFNFLHGCYAPPKFGLQLHRGEGKLLCPERSVTEMALNALLHLCFQVSLENVRCQKVVEELGGKPPLVKAYFEEVVA